MRALVCHAIDDMDSVILGDLPEPTPGTGEILIDVAAAGVNFADLLVLKDQYQFRSEPPFAPGMEAAGVVTAVGSDVDHVSVGDRVAVVGYSGAFAQRWAVDATMAVPVPDDIPWDVAAALSIGYGTSYHALKQRAGIEPGETILVLGAAGGVGSSAVELAVAMGARVIAAASSPEKTEFCRELGAHHVINYVDEDLRSVVKELTGGRGVDVVYDPVGGEMSEVAFRLLGWQGRHLVIGFAAGSIPSLPMNLPLLKGASLVGVFWGAFGSHQPELFRANAQDLFAMVSDGRIAPRITARFPLADARSALELVAGRAAMGRVVVEVDGATLADTTQT
jgi:NADPH2:quinone reductase